MPRGRNTRGKNIIEHTRLIETPEIMNVTTLGPIETESMDNPELFLNNNLETSQ
jgi:hypothetical protein